MIMSLGCVDAVVASKIVIVLLASNTEILDGRVFELDAVITGTDALAVCNGSSFVF